MKKVEVNIFINTKSASVIRAFTDPKMLREWWGVEKSMIETKIGGVYTLTWGVSESGIQYVSTGIICQYDPVHVLEVENFVYLTTEKSFLGPMRLLIKAVENEGFVEVYLCQDGYQSGNDWDWYFQAVKEAWPKVMAGLKKYLEAQK